MEIARVQYITNTITGLEPLLNAGLDWVQLRVKGQTEQQLYSLADKFVALCEKYGAFSIINDYPALVKKVGADGVHLGKEDMSVADARKILGEDFIIGGTANTIEDIEHLSEGKVDYIGLGPFRFTKTKTNLSPVLGLKGYEDIIQQCQQLGIHMPIIAIGGIVPLDLEALYQTGIHGVAVSSAISGAKNPVAELGLMLNA
jgi:thiamine-phosphate pyrophosphorylase